MGICLTCHGWLFAYILANGVNFSSKNELNFLNIVFIKFKVLKVLFDTKSIKDVRYKWQESPDKNKSMLAEVLQINAKNIRPVFCVRLMADNLFVTVLGGCCR